MVVLNPNDSTHIISVLPRVYNLDYPHVFNIYNEDTKEDILGDLNGTFLNNGYVVYDLKLSVSEGDSYSVKIVQETTDEIIWRGKMFATSQVPQNYNING